MGTNILQKFKELWPTLSWTEIYPVIHASVTCSAEAIVHQPAIRTNTISCHGHVISFTPLASVNISYLRQSDQVYHLQLAMFQPTGYCHLEIDLYSPPNTLIQYLISIDISTRCRVKCTYRGTGFMCVQHAVTIQQSASCEYWLTVKQRKLTIEDISCKIFEQGQFHLFHTSKTRAKRGHNLLELQTELAYQSRYICNIIDNNHLFSGRNIRTVHTANNTESSIICKSIIDQGSTGTYNVMTRVEPNLLQVKAEQKIHVMLYSDCVSFRTQPAFEILSPDTIAKHEFKNEEISEDTYRYLENRRLARTIIEDLFQKSFIKPSLFPKSP